MQFKRAKVVMLPTNEKANFPFFLDKSETRNGGVLFCNEGQNKNNWNWEVIEQKHLYIISNDESIKMAESYITNGKEVIFANFHNLSQRNIKDNSVWKVIIATTDRKYFKLPQPSQQFIEKFIQECNKGNLITDVMIEYETKITGYEVGVVGDIDIFEDVLKINPKDNTITIKKLKDSWSREEHVEGMWQAYKASNTTFQDEFALRKEFDEWVEKNL